MKRNNLITILLFTSVVTHTNTNTNISVDTNKVKIGSEAKDTGDKSIAIGYKAEAEKQESIAIGSEATSKATSGISIGKGAYVGSPKNTNGTDPSNAIAIGTSSQANSKNAIAIGEKANANTTDSIAIGRNTYTDGQNAISIGAESRANSGSIALGKKAISHNKGISIGENTHSQLNGVVIGHRAKSNGEHSENNVAIGADSKIDDNLSGATALGSNSEVKSRNSVALGSYSVAKERNNKDRFGYDVLTDKNVDLKDKLTKDKYDEYLNLEKEIEDSLKKNNSNKNNDKSMNNNLSKDFEEKYRKYSKISSAWKSHYGEVSIGDIEKGITRQITGLAAGTLDTDAVNVAQLKSLHKYVDKKVDKLGNNTISISGDSGSTEAQKLNKNGGLNFSIKGSEHIKTKASGSEVSIDISDKVKEDISKGVAANSGIANAIAMSNLAQVNAKGHNLSGSYGYYNGEHAFAIGLSGSNEKLVYRAGGSINTRGHVSLGAGIGYQFDNIEKRSKELLSLQRNGNINLLDEKVYEHELKIKLFEKELKELKNENIENNKKILQLIERIVKLEKNK
ncbi:YadA-like family protein [Streptobacillus moniliformis]|uniref:YadA-like family protein n=1 Tax=Streptobacillus moniliformis TaxID=34105 RepID=UPI0007E42BEB|nr:YadA-like family protein [Streptobacillus moniliformis]